MDKKSEVRIDLEKAQKYCYVINYFIEKLKNPEAL